jgi:dienelactone hydrolase
MRRKLRCTEKYPELTSPSPFSYLVNTYITYPKDNKTPEKAIVFLSDIFGIFPNSQLLADEFAKAGYLTVIPDLFQGDQISVADMESGKADLPSWLPKHQPANVDPVVEASIKYVRETLGVKSVGAVGYCFGAKVCFYDACDIYVNGYRNGFLTRYS